MTINIFILKRDLNGANRSGAFLFLSGIYEYLYLPLVDTKHIKANGKPVLEALI